MQDTIPTLVLRCADPACGLEFTPHRPGHKYHSPRCRKRHWESTHGRGAKPAPALRCPHCGTPLSLTLQASAVLHASWTQG